MSKFGWDYPAGCSGPPDDEEPCWICHKYECDCPVCDVCGEAGNPECINTHMPWRRWKIFLEDVGPDPWQDYGGA